MKKLLLLSLLLGCRVNLVRAQGVAVTASALQQTSAAPSGTCSSRGAVRIYNATVYVCPTIGAATWTALAGGGGGGTPGGSSGNLQVNNAGAFGGLSGSSFSGATLGLAGTLTIAVTTNTKPLVLRGSASQTLAQPHLQLQASDSSVLASITTNSQFNFFAGLEAGQNANPIGGESGVGHVCIGYRACKGGGAAGGSYEGKRNTVIGNYGMENASTSEQSTLVGWKAGAALTTAYKNVFVGVETGSATTIGGGNTALGTSALRANTSGGSNTVVGGQGLWNNNGDENVYIGYSPVGNGGTGSRNALGGWRVTDTLTAGARNAVWGALGLHGLDTGNDNAALGYATATTYNGSHSIIIGNQIDFPTSADNLLNVGNMIYGTGIDGSANTVSTGKIGIGVQAPNEKLSVAGKVESTTGGFKFPDGATLAAGAAVVLNNAGNTYSTGAQDFAAATSLKVPVAAGAAPATAGLIAYDSTANAFEAGVNGANKTFLMTDGSGANLTALNGTNISSGTVPVARLPVMVGDSGSGGTAGIVPAPATGDAAKCLSGAGTYVACSGGSGSPGGSDTQLQRNAGGAFGGISGATSDGTNVTFGSGNLRATSPQITTAIADSNGNAAIKLTATGSAVNEITVANAATTAGPTISATGTDTHIPLNFASKGDGNYNFAFPNATTKAVFNSGGGTGSGSNSAWFVYQSGSFMRLFFDRTGSQLALSGDTVGFVGVNGFLSWNGDETGISRAASRVLRIQGSSSTAPATISTPANSPSQITADQNNYAPGVGWFQRWNSDASRNITGASHQAIDGAAAIIVNTGSTDIVLKHQDAASSAANRYLSSTGADVTLGANAAALEVYDATTARRRIFPIGLAAGGGSGYATVAEEASGLTQRTTLNFIGSGITAVDNAGSSRTDVTVHAAGAAQEGTVSTAAQTFAGAKTFNGTLISAGGRKVSRTASSSASFAVAASGELISFTNAGATQTATLPDGATAGVGAIYTFVDESEAATGFNKTIARAGSDTFIGGGTSVILDCSGCSIRVIWTGTNWKIL